MDSIQNPQDCVMGFDESGFRKSGISQPEKIFTKLLVARKRRELRWN
jgi:hypothetical protein